MVAHKSESEACDAGYQGMIEEASSSQVSAVSRMLTTPSNRTLIEYCCSMDSRLGNERYVKRGCTVIRLTEFDDMTSTEGLQKAIDAVRSSPPGNYVHLWGSLPCTAGSPWQRINKRHRKARELIDANIKIFKKLIKHFRIVAKEVMSKGGDVSFEWPSQCALWQEEEVKGMVDELGMEKVAIHGCSLGLTDPHGVPIKKPWTIATTSSAMVDHFNPMTCPGASDHPIHQPCAGQLTKGTEGYTDQMTDLVHAAISDEALLYVAQRAMVAL